MMDDCNYEHHGGGHIHTGAANDEIFTACGWWLRHPLCKFWLKIGSRMGCGNFILNNSFGVGAIQHRVSDSFNMSYCISVWVCDTETWAWDACGGVGCCWAEVIWWQIYGGRQDRTGDINDSQSAINRQELGGWDTNYNLVVTRLPSTTLFWIGINQLVAMNMVWSRLWAHDLGYNGTNPTQHSLDQ